MIKPRTVDLELVGIAMRAGTTAALVTGPFFPIRPAFCPKMPQGPLQTDGLKPHDNVEVCSSQIWIFALPFAETPQIM